MTEQQEFLEYLKDPIKAQLQLALDKFHAEHPEHVDRYYIVKLPNNVFNIELYSYNERMLNSEDVTKSFVECLHYGVTSNSIWVNVRSHPGEQPQNGLYRRSYFIDILSKPSAYV